MNVDHDALMAYVDGELSPEDAARVETAIAADPRVAEAVSRQRALRRIVQQAYAPVLEEPVPDALARLVRDEVAPLADVLPLAARAKRTVSAHRWGPPQWAAMAASLLLGVAISQWVLQPQVPPLQLDGSGRLLAGGELASGLGRQLASAPEAGTAVAIGLSFRDAAGRYCRSFAWDGAQPLSGLACRQEDQRWEVVIVTQAAPAPSGELRQAATALSPAVLAEVEARMAGDSLDGAQERQARDAGWR